MIRKGWGIFPTKNRFLADITFYFDGAGKESLLQVACLAWRCLGLSLPFSFLFSFAAAALSSLSSPKLFTLFLTQGGKTKRKKGGHKTSFGHGSGFQQIREKGLQHLLFPLFFFFLSFWGPLSLLPRPRRPCWAFSFCFSTCSGCFFDWLGN